MATIYLAAPYSHTDPAIIDWRVEKVDRLAAKLMDAGHIVFSPVSHSHRIARYTHVEPCNHEFWLRQDLPWMVLCKVFMIYCLPGWRESRGIIEKERPRAIELGLTLDYYADEHCGG